MLRLTGLNRRTRYFLYGLCLLVLAVSASIVLAYNDHFLLGSPELLNNDDVKYAHSARVLLNHGTVAYNSGEEPSTFIMPGMPFLVAFFMLLFGQGDGGIIAFRLFQCVLQAASVYLVFALARRVFNDRTAIVAAVLSALYIPDYFSSGTILSETTFKFLLLLLIIVMIEAVERKGLGWYVSLGAIVAAAAYFKPHISLFPVLLLFFWLKGKMPLKDMAVRAGIVGAVFGVLLSPWWVRNAVVFHKFIPFTQSAGNPFLLGTLIEWQRPSEGFFEKYPQYKDDLFIGGDKEAIETGKRIIAFELRERPLTYLHWLTLGKIKHLYQETYYWKGFWGIPDKTVSAIQYWLVLLAAIGILFSLIRDGMRRSWQSLYLLLPLAYMTAIYLPFITFSRYGYPNMPLLIIFSSWFVAQAASVAAKRMGKAGSQTARPMGH